MAPQPSEEEEIPITSSTFDNEEEEVAPVGPPKEGGEEAANVLVDSQEPPPDEKADAKPDAKPDATGDEKVDDKPDEKIGKKSKDQELPRPSKDVRKSMALPRPSHKAKSNEEEMASIPGEEDSRTGEAYVQTVHRPSETDSHLSGTDSDGYLEGGSSTEGETEGDLSEEGGSRKSKVQKTAESSKAHFDKNTISMLAELSPEVRRRLSEDTIFLGRRVHVRTFDQKVELLKKVWDVHTMIQAEGLTLEQAKEMLTPSDIGALEDAESLTSGNLLKYVAALFPDENKYPVQRTLAGKRSTRFRGIVNSLAAKPAYNLSDKYLLRHMDLFWDIFDRIPSKEQLMVSDPLGVNVKEADIIQVTAMPDQPGYPSDLHGGCHKPAQTSNPSKIRVRRAKERDMAGVKYFLNSIIDSETEWERIFQDFLLSFTKTTIKGVPKMTPYLLEAKNDTGIIIAGVLMVSKEVLSMRYSVNYDLEKHLYYAAYDPNIAFGYVHHLVIDAGFTRHARLFLKEIMRLDKKEVLFHCVFPDYVKNKMTLHQSTLSSVEDWVAVTPRKRIHYEHLNLTDTYDDERQPPLWAQDILDPFALIHISKKFILDPKIPISDRLVFVGASTTTISCLEKLVSDSYRSFKHLTVIDPFGLPGTLPTDPARDEFFAVRNGGAKMSYDTDREWVFRTGVHLWVRVVVGRVTSIFREEKCVVVNSEHVVPYDKLVLAPGRQFQRVDCPEPEIKDPNFMAFKKNTSVGFTDEMQESTPQKFNSDIPKPKNVFLINTEVEATVAMDFIKLFKTFMKKKKILVFGGGLQSYTCVKALLACEIPADRIVMISSPDRYIEWEMKSGYTLSSKVRNPMRDELEKIGVILVDNYEFSHWETCTVSGLVKRTHFESLTEGEAHVSYSTYALFCYRYKRVDDGIVSALSEAYLLYQDGIVIDSGFKTNDPNIYACGPASTYQKILMSEDQNHIFYQSEEIGHQLADFLIESCASEEEDQGNLDTFNVIKFKKPLIRAMKLLGDWHYLYLRSPGYHSGCTSFGGTCEEKCECTIEVVTGSIDIEEDPQQRYFKVRLDNRSKIVSLECMSKTPFSFSNMSALYGKHETILNKMMERLELGETTCLYDHFCQSWFAIFCVDEWDSFAEELKELYMEHDIGDGITLIQFIRDVIVNLDNPEALQMDPNILRSVFQSSEIKKTVEEKLLNFLKYQRFTLPMFACHNYVEDLLEERSYSPLYQPNTKSHLI